MLSLGQRDSSILPTLEVEFLDREAEDEGKERSPRKKPNSGEFEKAAFEAEVVLDVLLQYLRLSSAALQDKLGGHVTKLRVHEATENPRKGTHPVVPDPPGRNVLQGQAVENQASFHIFRNH